MIDRQIIQFVRPYQKMVSEIYLTKLLLKDVAALPLIFRSSQEMWLGIHLQAPKLLRHFHGRINRSKSLSDAAHEILAMSYQSFLTNCADLERECLENEVSPPIIETWVAELLSVRQNIFTLRRSRLRRFVKMCQSLDVSAVGEKVANLTFDIAELLGLLSDEFLSYMIKMGRDQDRLPAIDDLLTFLETSTMPHTFYQDVQSRTKKARNALVTGYIRYVLRMARNYVGQGVDYLDLVQEGCLGMMKAIERFDYRRSTRFVHYGTTWIWQAIGRAIAEQSRIIRLPIHLQEQISKIEKAYQEALEAGKINPVADDILPYTDLLSDALPAISEYQGQRQQPPLVTKRVDETLPATSQYQRRRRRTPSITRYADEVLPVTSEYQGQGQQTTKHVDEATSQYQEPDLPDHIKDKIADEKLKAAIEKIEELSSYAQPVVPLECIFRVPAVNEIGLLDDECTSEFSLVDLVPDWDNPLPADVADQHAMEELVEQVLETLTTRQREVIRLRFGLEDGESRTLEEIGQHFGLSRERIRQIESKTLEKLKHCFHHKDSLYDFLKSCPAQLAYLPLEILTQLEEEFDYWKGLQVESESTNQYWTWLDALLEDLPRARARHFGGITRQDQLLDVLEELSIPTHCSDITEQLNDALEGDELDETYVYNLLMRYDETFALLGQAVFSLIRWEHERAKQTNPVLPFCPATLPDPPGQSDAFFESVLVARETLQKDVTAKQFLQSMFNWAGTSEMPPTWLAQSVLSAYYLVGLIDYAYCLEDNDPTLKCTLPKLDIHKLRFYCLDTLNDRLMVMPEFWWLFQRCQPIRPSGLGERFVGIHPMGLDDVGNRLNILTSLGVARKLSYGRYELTSLGEEIAEQLKRQPVTLSSVKESDHVDTLEDVFDSLDLFVW